LTKLLDEMAGERKSYRDRAEQLGRTIRARKQSPQDEATKDEIERLDHYGFVVLPARVRRPRDKAKVAPSALFRASCSASCAIGASSPWPS
jgi:hypothetical protein